MRAGHPDYSPWEHLGHLEGVRLLWHDGGPAGETDFDQVTISLRRGLSRVERRSTLAHELIHLERGAVANIDAATQYEEYLVEASAALRLIPAGVLGRLPELVRMYGEEAGQAFLDVDHATLMTAVEVVKASH